MSTNSKNNSAIYTEQSEQYNKTRANRTSAQVLDDEIAEEAAKIPITKSYEQLKAEFQERKRQQNKTLT
ncbi:MAG: hypothetical protein OCD00_15810 [Colwellia sp.]